jgi:hypothetical protein
METIKVYTDVYNRVKKNFPALEPQAMFRLEWAYFVVFDQLLDCDDYRALPQYPELYGFLKSRALRIAGNRWFALKRRIAAFTLMFGTSPYRYLLKRNERDKWKIS